MNEQDFAQLEELRKRYKDYKPLSADAEALRVVEAENARLKAALAWYADEDTYMWWLTDQPTLIEVDRGERARKALEGGSEHG